MPVKSNGVGKPPITEMPPIMEKKESCCGTNKPMMMGHGSCCGHSHANFGRRLLLTLFGILLAYGIVFLGTLIRNNVQKYYFIGQADRTERTIMVQGVGKVTVKPDIAMISMGMTADGKTVAEAQQKNTDGMNALLTKVKALGVDAKDIQTTNYNIYPQYDYTADKGQVLKGYQVSQSVDVKIRDLTKANQVLALSGEVGANNVGGVQFTIDDREVYKTQARELAMKQIAEKARALSQALGVKLVNVVSYDEYENNGNVPYSAMKMLDSSTGVGGPEAAAPQIETGTNDVVLNVNVGFEIR